MSAQVIGNLIITVSTFALAMGLMYLVSLTGTLRVSKEGELEGLDLHEHGIPASPGSSPLEEVNKPRAL